VLEDAPAGRGLIETSVVIGLERIDPEVLPSRMAISARRICRCTPRTPLSSPDRTI
jgi:hypothetical protein